MDQDSSSDVLDAVVLDPHPIWLDALEVVLARAGAQVVAKTTSGREALAAIERHKPRLLTLELDAQPGELNGLEVLRKAKAIAPSLRAIVLSAHHDTDYIDDALAAGAAACAMRRPAGCSGMPMGACRVAPPWPRPAQTSSWWMT